ncbi:MAG: glycosyltransferase family 2 protein [Kovacikia sp.]
MITRQGQVQHIKPFLRQSKQHFPWITACLLGLAAFWGAIAVSGFTHQAEWSQLFCWLNLLQRQAAEGFQAPDEKSVWILTLGLLLGTQVLMRVSPQPNRWSRVVMITILLALTARYMLWRSLATLNLDTPLNGVFSLGLFFTEMLVISNSATRLFLMLRERDRRQEADRYAIAVETGAFLPSVAILIPTHSEPAFILRRTLIGCLALDYPHKAIYLLDDGKRPEIQKLAAELGCHYIARPTNRHAKAGNLNYAIGKTSSDLITVFDADFIPTRNFLSRTVGFFQNQTIGLVQTHQHFYNPDSFARNLGLEKEVPHENEAFGRHYMPIRDGSNSSLCYGSSFVVRRRALQEVGGFTTQSVSEDLYTGIRIAANGYQVIYLDEHLSAGLVPEDMPSQVIQRQRWTRGSIQAFFLKENPVTIPGFNLRQRIAYVEGIFQWFNSPARLGFLLLPVAVAFLGIIPISTTIRDWSYFFLPLYLIQLSTFAWLNHRASSGLLADVYSVMNCFPVSETIFRTLIGPFSTGFRVTPKGTTNSTFVFHWKLALPLVVLLMLNIASLAGQGYMLVMRVGTATNPESAEYLRLGLIWGLYNLLVIGLAVLSFIDVPKLEANEWLQQRRSISLQVADQRIEGTTTRISETGVEMIPSDPDLCVWLNQDEPVMLRIPEGNLVLPAKITASHPLSNELDRGLGQLAQRGNLHLPSIQNPKSKIQKPAHSNPVSISLAFAPLTPEQHHRLIEWLFCQPGQWQRQNTPGEFRMAGLLLRSLLRPRFLSKTA